MEEFLLICNYFIKLMNNILDSEDTVKHRITEENLWEIEMKYQKEIERLERENKELRQQILLRNPASQGTKKVRVS